MRTLVDRVAVVTGAASGIGRAIAIELAKQGCHLALVDLNEVGLSDTARNVESVNHRATPHVCDVSDRMAVEILASDVVAAHGRIDVLINNAGVSVAGRFDEQSLENFDWIMGVNFWGAVHGCRFFLPHLRSQTEAHIVNIGSEFGLLGFPTKSAYCASKFALRGFTESLRSELFGTSIGVTMAYPGAVDTNIVHAGRVVDESKRVLEAEFIASRSMPAERVATVVVRAIRKNKARVRIGRDAWMFDLAARIFPTFSAWAIGRFHRRIPFL